MDGLFRHSSYELSKLVPKRDDSGTPSPVDGFRGKLARSLEPKDLGVWLDVHLDWIGSPEKYEEI